MTTRIAALVAAAFIIAGCGGTELTPAADLPAAEAPVAYEPPSGPVYTPPAEQAEYATPADLAKVLNARDVRCQLDADGPGQDILGSTNQTCWMAGQDQLLINIYTSVDQQADGVAMLKGNHWQVVEGQLWTVSAMSPAVATQVVQALQK